MKTQTQIRQMVWVAIAAGSSLWGCGTNNPIQSDQEVALRDSALKPGANTIAQAQPENVITPNSKLSREEIINETLFIDTVDGGRSLRNPSWVIRNNQQQILTIGKPAPRGAKLDSLRTDGVPRPGGVR